MGINITEIAQKVLDNNTNAANVFRKMYDLHYNPNPLDVPFEYIDENGNKVTTTIKNQAGFRKKVWDDVGGALGQFNKTFYVDATNGDDNNTGASDSPFKTLQKACDSVPVGGFGLIQLLSDYNDIFNANFKKIQIVVNSEKIWTIPMGSTCNITGSQVLITNYGQLIVDRGDGSDINGNNYSGFLSTNFENSSTLSRTTSLYLVNNSNKNSISPVVRIDSDRALFGSRTYGANQNIQLNCSIYNIYTNGDFILDGNLMVLNSGSGILQWNTYGTDTTLNVVDSGGNAVDIKTKIAGIIKDSNGVPRNIISNIVF